MELKSPGKYEFEHDWHSPFIHPTRMETDVVLPTDSCCLLKASCAKGQSLSRRKSSKTDDVNSQDEVARSPKVVSELMDTQPSQETSVEKLSTLPPARHLAALRKMFNVPTPSDDDLEPGEIRDSSSIQSMDDETSSDHSDLKIKLDGSAKTIQTTSEAGSLLRVQPQSRLRRRRQAPGPQSAPKNHGQATLAQTHVFEQGFCTVSTLIAE